ncbi:hypothetical protein HK096_008381, partial [Nowakowskiella sp. JEL0078]
DMAKTLFDGVETLPNITFATGNILDAYVSDLMIKCKDPDYHFDAVFQRLLIFGIPKDKWDTLIKELIRVSKPGRFIEIVEIDLNLENTGPKEK